jgi:quercetin dioxygenase-like cupin family protein
VKICFGAAVCAAGLAIGLTAGGGQALAAGAGPVVWFPDGQADSLRCYEVKDSTPVRRRSVYLEDDFGRDPPKRIKLRKPAFYCNPVVKDREAASVDPISPMTCYRIRSRQPKRTVEIENVFGAQTLVIDDAKHLCVPSMTVNVARGDRLDDNRGRGHGDHKDHDEHEGDGDSSEVPPVSTQILLSSSETVLGQQIVYPTGSDAQITAAIVTMQPGAETGLHRHEAPLFGYLIQGELTVTYETGFVKVLRPGDSLLEAFQTRHNGRNTSKGVVRILVVFAGAEGVPNTVPLD